LRQQLPDTEEGEYYWKDLIGYHVQRKDGTTLGTIDHLFRTPGNDVIVAKNGGNKYLIPWTKDVVLTTDMTERCITVDWDSDLC
jgi:16S rRNA processing protein RimM